MRRFVVVSDIHGIEHDPRAVQAALAFTKSFNPEIRVIAGDLWDFAAIRNGASQEERAISMAEDFEVGRNIARKFFKGGKENHLMLGNHDVRIWDLMDSQDAVRADLGRKMVENVKALCRETKSKLWPYDSRLGVLEIGHLSIIHGFHSGTSAAAAHSRIYGNVLYGHNHGIESYQTPGLTQQEARCIGCLCKLDMGYADRKTGKLRWAHGFAYGWVFDDGTYQVNQVRGINGKFHACTELKEF